jgi:intracellular sulfur oxidation DsrE/DsrF family protein
MRIALFKINLMKTFFLFFNLLLGFGQLANSQTTSSHKIIFQLTTADTLAHKALMKQIKNIKSVSPETKIEVVCHGPGLEMLQKEKSTVRNGIKESTKMGVEFKACEFSLKERKVEKSSIVEESGFVEAGILYIVSKQEQGWIYIKAGF